jgi:hypothetical protein
VVVVLTFLIKPDIIRIMKYLKAFWVFMLILIVAFALKESVALSASPSHGGVYNEYSEPDEDFQYFDGDEFDCNTCDDDDDDNDNSDDEPEATTRSASSISTTSAILNARADGNGASTRVWFEFGDDRDMEDETPSKSIGSGTDTVSVRVTGLRRDRTYYFRAVARNSEGTDYGSIMSFRTDNNDNNDDENSDELVARTIVATSISLNSAQLNSVIQNDSSERVDTWFEWGATTAFGNRTEVVRVDASPSVAHRAFITGLAPGRPYYFRAVAESGDEISRGSVFSFTTSSAIAPSSGSGKTNPPPATGGNTIEETPETTTPVENKPEQEEEKLGLAANVVGFGFFPSTLLGWLAFIILVLGIYILARKYLFPNPKTETVTIHHEHH